VIFCVTTLGKKDFPEKNRGECPGGKKKGARSCNCQGTKPFSRAYPTCAGGKWRLLGKKRKEEALVYRENLAAAGRSLME